MTCHFDPGFQVIDGALFIDPRPNLIDALAAENVQRDAASHYRRQAYKLRLQKWVTGLCVAAAVFAVVWFGGLELIGLVK